MITWAVIYLSVAAISGFYALGEVKSFPTKMARLIFGVFITLFFLSIIYSFLPPPYMV